VAAAVAQLPEQQRTVVVLRVWNGLSYGEIADILACSEGTARSHMHHGLGALRKYLERRMG
jgi:RNA polymerase sigma-70 factor (ECF subfamily)